MQNIDDEEEIKNKFIRLLHQMIYEWRFEDLINLINVKYPAFFASNQNIFYIITKFSFIKIILFQHDINAAQDFYSKYLTNIMKKIYGNNSSSYNKKHFKYQYFLEQINNNDKYIYFQHHFKAQTHLEKFCVLLEKSFQKEKILERNPVIFNVTKANINNNKINNNGGKPLFKTERVNNLTYYNENMSEIEDELFKLNLGETKKNIFNVHSFNDKNMNKKNIFINRNNYSDIDTNSNNNNIDDYNNSSDISNTFPENNNRNKIDSKKFLEKNELYFDCKEKCTFNNKIRRVNLCKKIVRKFRKYLKSNKKDINYSFWNAFCRENYLPPFKTEDFEFKSFSRIYLNWLFSHEGGVELYNEFVRNKGDEELNNMYSSYGINDLEEKKDLENFFKKFSIYFLDIKKNESENVNNFNDNSNDINNEMKHGNIFQADFANNLFENYIPNKEDNLSVGSINEFCVGERNKNKEYIRGREARESASDSSNSSMENANFNYNNISHNNNYNIYKNDDFNCEYKNYDNNNTCNFHVDGFSLYANNSNYEKYENKEDSHFYPDNNFSEYNNNINNNINASFPHYFFNNETEDIYNKKFNNFNED